MKVGDLVKNKMSDRPAIVLKIRSLPTTRFQVVPHVLILNKESSAFWDKMSDWEVISEGR